MNDLKRLLESMSQKTHQDHRPFTEALPIKDGRLWTSEPAAGLGIRVDRERRVLHVPYSDTEIATNLRRQEMARAQFGMQKPLEQVAAEHDVSYQSLVYAEQLRLSQTLQHRVGADMSAGLRTEAEVRGMVEEVKAVLASDPIQAMRMALYQELEFTGTRHQRTWRQELAGTPLGEPTMRIADSIVRHMRAEPPATMPPWKEKELREYNALPYDQRQPYLEQRLQRAVAGRAIPEDRAISAARYLDDIIEAMEELMSGQQPGNQAGPQEPGDEEEEREAEKDLRGQNTDLLQEMLDALDPGERSMNGEVPWGQMTIEEPARPVYHPAARAARRRRSSDQGINPKHVHRLVTDGRVFQTKRRLPGGACLIDGSGSMGMSPEDVVHILTLAPQAVVAIYAGEGNGTGVLRILAKDGRQVEQRLMHRPARGANEIDGPALDWLGKQEKPRIWVSDGVVTGVGDQQCPKLTLDARLKKRRFRVRQVESVARAIEVFARERRKLADR